MFINKYLKFLVADNVQGYGEYCYTYIGTLTAHTHQFPLSLCPMYSCCGVAGISLHQESKIL